MHVIEILRLPQSEWSGKKNPAYYTVSDSANFLAVFFIIFGCRWGWVHAVVVVVVVTSIRSHIVSVLSASLVVWFIWLYIFGIDITFNSTNIRIHFANEQKFMIARLA